MEIFKILVICLIASALALILKQYKSEYAFSVVVVAGILVFIIVLKNIFSPIEVLRQKFESYGVEITYFKTAVKALGIGYVTSFVADACRDSGQNSLASKAEFAGKCAIFIISLPLILSVMETAVGFIT